MIDYPQKGSHYAHKTFRLMHKAMVAAEHGRDVFCLLSVILHTEDAARYRGPVSYYNTQLMETLGFKKWEQFDAVRAKAIASGWLQYEGCGKRTPGKYFVTIPDGFEQVDDGLMEECISPENGYKRGYDEGYKLGYDAGVMWGINRGTMSAQTGGQTGGTSYPIPTPDPNPIPTPENTPPGPQGGKRGKKKKADFVPSPPFDDFDMPASHKCDILRNAWNEWMAYRNSMAMEVSKVSAVKSINALSRMAVNEAVASINRSIARNWENIIPCPRNEVYLYFQNPNDDEIRF